MTSSVVRESFATFQVSIGTPEPATINDGVLFVLSKTATVPQIPFGADTPAYAVEYMASDLYRPVTGNNPAFCCVILSTLPSDEANNVVTSAFGNIVTISDIFEGVARLENNPNVIDTDLQVNLAESNPPTISVPITGTIKTTGMVIQTGGDLGGGGTLIDGSGDIDSNSIAAELAVISDPAQTGVLTFNVDCAITLPSPLQSTPEVSSVIPRDYEEQDGEGFLTLSPNLTITVAYLQKTGFSQNGQYAVGAITAYARYRKISKDDLTSLAVRQANFQ